MAEVMPAPMAMVRKAAFTPLRFGRPKLMLEAPQVVFTRSSSRKRRTRRMAWTPAWPTAPMGITKGSTTRSSLGMPWSIARSTIFCATAKRSSGSSEMPVSSLEMATTAAPCFFTKGRTLSSTASSPVTEFTSALP